MESTFSTSGSTTRIPTISAMTSVESPLTNGDLQVPSLISGISSIPMQLFSEGNKLLEKEKHFLEAAEKGNKASVERFVLPPDPVNVNVTNLVGRSALQMAVDNENIEIVELLLAQPGIEIGDALFQAIREGVYRMVEMMVNHPSISRQMLGDGWSTTYKSGRKESSDYSPDISPVILAAHCNQFEILQLLLTRGATIYKPHSVVCVCVNCSEKQKADSLRYSLDRICCFRALASPAWISLTSNDPVLTAFQLSWELHMLSTKENEFKDIFQTLESQTKLYAVELLEECRSTEEVVAVLNKESEEDDPCYSDRINEGQIELARFKLALKYDQKKFVAHPHAQQLLASIWYDGFPGWRRRSLMSKIFICFGLTSLLPFMAIYYLFFPRSRVGQLMRSPFMKFMNHSASFMFFLLMLVYASISKIPCGEDRRGRQFNGVEGLIMVFTFGMIWAECKQIWEEGLKAYIRQWWNWLDFIMLSMYLCTIGLRFATMIMVQRGDGSYSRDIPRRDWPKDDPTLLAEGIFSVANVFSFARIIFLFQANPYLGPLQISLGCMLIDIFKFLLIFFLVLLSFACGMNKLYSNYETTGHHCSNISSCGTYVEYTEFDGLGRALLTLVWALFGLIGKDVILIQNEDSSLEIFGELLFLSYQLVAIVVLLNMLIAMMSSSFQIIENHADVEWKFARSKLWMSYFDEGSTLPPPFNLLISPKSVYNCYQYFKRALCSRLLNSRRMRKMTKKDSMEGSLKQSQDGSPPSPGTPELRYQDVMKRLVSRYIHRYKAKLKADGVNEDDLNEIKQDISSLRYELREDRKKESTKGKDSIEGIKSDILNALKEQTPIPNKGDGHPRLPAPGTPANDDTPSNQRLRVPANRRGRNVLNSRDDWMNSTCVNNSPEASPSRSSANLSRDDLERAKFDIISSLREELKQLKTESDREKVPDHLWFPADPAGYHNSEPPVPSAARDAYGNTRLDVPPMRSRPPETRTRPLAPSPHPGVPEGHPAQIPTLSVPRVNVHDDGRSRAARPSPRGEEYPEEHAEAGHSSANNPSQSHYFQQLDGRKLNVDINGIRQRASTPGIRYHLSPTMYGASGTDKGGTHSLTQL